MNNSVQAQKGFKTFLLTLSISLIVFSVIYYVITSTSSSDTAMDLSPNVESSSPTAMNTTEDVSNYDAQNNNDGQVAGAMTERTEDTTSKAPTTTAFAELATQQMNVPQRQVLAGATVAQTSQSTSGVPNGGSVEITIGLLTSLLAFAVGIMLVAKDPRKMALLGFEKSFIKEL